MKILRNFALSMVIFAALFLSLAGCNGQDDSSHKRELAGHIAREAELEADCAEKDLEIARLQSERDARIEEIEARIEELEAALEEEQAKDRQYTYTFEEAYEAGKITRSDLMHFSYYWRGKVFTPDPQNPGQEKEIQFTPSEEQGEMDTVTTQRIQLAWLLENYWPSVGYNNSTGQIEILDDVEDYDVESWFLTEKGYYMIALRFNGPYVSVHRETIIEQVYFCYSANIKLYVIKF